MGRIKDVLGSRIGIQIGGSWEANPVQKEAIAILGKNLPEAIKQGRTEVAVAIVTALAQSFPAPVTHATVQNTNISTGD